MQAQTTLVLIVEMVALSAVHCIIPVVYRGHTIGLVFTASQQEGVGDGSAVQLDGRFHILCLVAMAVQMDAPDKK